MQDFSLEQLTERMLHRRAVQAVIWGMPAVNFELLRQATSSIGAADNQVVFWSRLPDWKNQTLTPNPDTLYFFPFYNTRDAGPMVLEIPPAEDGSITGSVDDGWELALDNVGPAGVDQGRGGKYLIVPPGNIEPLSDDYIPLRSPTFAGFAALRSNIDSTGDADIAKAVTYGKRPPTRRPPTSSMRWMRWSTARFPTICGSTSCWIGLCSASRGFSVTAQ